MPPNARSIAEMAVVIAVALLVHTAVGGFTWAWPVDCVWLFFGGSSTAIALWWLLPRRPEGSRQGRLLFENTLALLVICSGLTALGLAWRIVVFAMSV